MTFSRNKKSSIPFWFLFFLLPTLVNAYDLEFDILADTAYLPYRSFEDRDVIKSEDCSYQEYNLIEVLKPAVKNKLGGLMILSDNRNISSGGGSVFTPRTFPGYDVTDDDPLAYTTTIWKLYTFDDKAGPYVIGVCHNDSSILAFKLFIDSDSVEYKLIYTKQADDPGPVVPNASVLYVGDFGSGADKQILLFLEYRGHIRRLLLLDFETLNIRWTKSVASGVNPMTFRVFSEGDNFRLIFATGNSANGMTDSAYNDYYSYITILDADGEFLSNQLTGRYGQRASSIIFSNVDNEFFITHYLDFATGDSVGSKTLDEYYLSRMDSTGKLLKSIIIKSTPSRLWLMRYGDENELRLFVLYNSKAIEMYDCEMNLLAESVPTEKAMLYGGRYKIAGESDSVYVFSDGFYDRNLNKLMHFPFYSGNMLPIEYDTLGNMTAYVITGNKRFYIGYIQKRTTIELASVFYHRNKNYVLIFLSSLLVALVTTNIFRRRSQSNLKLISQQKIELETTHLKLKEAQAQLVAQEKFEQAKDIAGGFAHEIRNALSPARNALSRLLGVPADQKKARTLAELTNRGVIKALNLTQQISNYTKLESQKNQEPVNLVKIVDDLLLEHEHILREYQIAVSWAPTEEIRTTQILSNNDQMRIVITNLISNAIDAMQGLPTKRLVIECTQQESAVELTIADNGCGIPKGELGRVFDFFYSTKPDTGTGIGLALSRKIVELYGGTITVHGNQDKLTTFTVQMPLIIS